jgi:hypothetical protein
MRRQAQEGLTMGNDIGIRRLINFEAATDGTAVRLVAEDSAGRTIGIILTIETLSALLMTLPRMASDAIKRAHGDSGMRITYPAADFQLELSWGNVRILPIETPDGFTVSFSLTGGIVARTRRGSPQGLRPARQDALSYSFIEKPSAVPGDCFAG